MLDDMFFPELGTCLASKKISVVYGGGRFGIMGKMADSVLAHQGKLTGIIPKFFTGTVKNNVSRG